MFPIRWWLQRSWFFRVAGSQGSLTVCWWCEDGVHLCLSIMAGVSFNSIMQLNQVPLTCCQECSLFPSMSSHAEAVNLSILLSSFLGILSHRNISMLSTFKSFLSPSGFQIHLLLRLKGGAIHPPSLRFWTSHALPDLHAGNVQHLHHLWWQSTQFPNQAWLQVLPVY